MSHTPPFAIITGASRGIGSAYARQLAEQGYNLLLVGRDHKRLDRITADLQSKYGGMVEKEYLDLTDSGAAQTLYARAMSLNHPVSILIHNAGFGLYGTFAETSHAKIMDMLHLHVLQITESTRLFLPDMVARGQAAIIIVSSLAGLFPIPYMAEYAATKTYLNTFFEALAQEMDGTGVTIQVCCPGFTDTDFHKTAGYRPRHVLCSQSPHQVATVSLNALKSRRTMVMIGWQGHLAYWMTRVLPRRLLMSLAARFVKPPSPLSPPPPTT
ncbi:MAG: SDR family NAD(P)-dependent oxidoreductase [Nitrospirales bacterium]|nr:SDR family oxidoreductase [Nitrospirales bacterium]